MLRPIAAVHLALARALAFVGGITTRPDHAPLMPTAPMASCVWENSLSRAVKHTFAMTLNSASVTLFRKVAIGFVKIIPEP